MAIILLEIKNKCRFLMVQKIANKKKNKKQIVTLQYLMTSRKSATKTLIGKLRVADTNDKNHPIRLQPSEMFSLRSWRDSLSGRQTFSIGLKPRQRTWGNGCANDAPLTYCPMKPQIIIFTFVLRIILGSCMRDLYLKKLQTRQKIIYAQRSVLEKPKLER